MTELTVMAETLSSEPTKQWDPADASNTTASRFGRVLDPTSPALIYLGVVVAIVGFVLIAIGWAAVAGKVDVWRQMPYVLSAGLPGIGLVMTGLVLVNVAVRRQDGANRKREMATLAEALRDLQRSLDQR